MRRDPPHAFLRTVGTSAAVHGTLMVALLVLSLVQGCARTRRPRELVTYIDMGAAVPSVQVPEIPIPQPPDPEPPKPPEDIPENLTPRRPSPRPVQVQTNRVVRRPSTPARPVLTAAQIRERMGAGPQLPGDGDIIVPAWYLQQVRLKMYEAWAQPSGLAAAGISVDADIRIRKDGRIDRRRILRSSGNEVMDRSVRQAMDAVDRLDPLPAAVREPYVDITITFQLQGGL